MNVSALKDLANIKINLIAALAISLVSSLATVAASGFVFAPTERSESAAMPLVTSGQSVVDCDVGVYSPVQKTCVSKEQFNLEMKRLFAALGIDTSIYEQDHNN